MRGLEIGPLARPRVKKADGRISYVDHCSTEELRRAYSANSLMRPHLDEIVEVDYVIKDGSTLSEAIGTDGPFDYIIASHVLEHLANPIGWLQDVAKVLTADGLVSLVIPDKRYCFDVNRAETRPQDWVDWYLRDLRAPSYGQLFDFFAHVTTIDGMVDTAALWAGTVDYDGVRRPDVPDADIAAYASCLHYRDTEAYMDVHAGVYTPRSLLALIELGVKLELLNFEVAYFAPTRRDSLEFHITLRGRAPSARPEALASVAAAQGQLATADVPAVVAATPAEPVVTPPVPEVTPPVPEVVAAAPGPQAPETAAPPSHAPSQPGASMLEVSAKERAVILLKRTAMDQLRGLLRKL
jgi:predicted SAM-dependent methyltransferase